MATLVMAVIDLLEQESPITKHGSRRSGLNGTTCGYESIGQLRRSIAPITTSDIARMTYELQPTPCINMTVSRAGLIPGSIPRKAVYNACRLLWARSLLQVGEEIGQRLP